MVLNSTPHGGEKLIRIVSEHWIKYVFPIFIATTLLSISLLLFVLAGLTAHHYMWLSHASFVAALLLFLVTHHWFFLILLGESATHIIVTNHRVMRIRERVLFSEERLEVSFDRMKTVEAKKHGVLQTILRYGNLQFEGEDTIIPLVPHPNSIARDIEQAMGR